MPETDTGGSGSFGVGGPNTIHMVAEDVYANKQEIVCSFGVYKKRTREVFRDEFMFRPFLLERLRNLL